MVALLPYRTSTAAGFKMANTPDPLKELGHRPRSAPDTEITAIRHDGQRSDYGPLSGPPTAHLGSNINEGSLPHLSYLHGLIPPPSRYSSEVTRHWVPSNNPSPHSVGVSDVSHLNGLLRARRSTLKPLPHSVEAPVPSEVQTAVATSADSYSPDSEFHKMRCETLYSYVFPSEGANSNKLNRHRYRNR